MQKSTLILGAILLLLIVLATLFLIGGTLSAQLNVAVAMAQDHPQAFESIRGILAAGTAPQAFTEAVPPTAEGLRLEDVTITLTNRGLIDAEWLNVQVEGASGDIAVYSLTGEGGTVQGRGSGAINLKLICQSQSTGARTYRLQYYVLGMKRSLTLRQEPQN